MDICTTRRITFAEGSPIDLLCEPRVRKKYAESTQMAGRLKPGRLGQKPMDR